MMSSDEVNNVPKLPIADVDFKSIHKELEKEKKVIKMKKEVFGYIKQKEFNARDFQDIDMIPDYRKICDDEGRQFRIQNNAYLLTYPTHIDKDSLIKFICSKIKKFPKFIRTAWENEGEGILRDCTHIFFRCDGVFKSESKTIFEFNGINPCIRIINCVNKTTYDKAVRYLSRSDEANIDLDSVGNNYANKIWDCDSEAEALAKYAKGPNDASGISHIYANKPKKQARILIKEIGGDDCPWDANEFQLEVINTIKEAAYDDRKINWYYDYQGSSGKSKLSRDFMRSGMAWVIKNTGGGESNVAQNLRTALEKGWDGKVVVFDLARDIEDSESKGIYRTIEAIKDAMLSASKYLSTTLELPEDPLVFVFANFEPCHTKENGKPTVTYKRWNIVELVDEGIIDRERTKEWAKYITDLHFAWIAKMKKKKPCDLGKAPKSVEIDYSTAKEDGTKLQNDLLKSSCTV